MKRFFTVHGGLWVAQGCLAILTCLLLALDVGAYWITAWFLRVSHGLEGLRDSILLLISIYACSLPAWVAVGSLWKLLRAIAKGEIFSAANVKRLRATAACCFAVCLATALSTLYYLPMLLPALAACFIGGIVCIVTGAFQKALQMQEELAFTI